jgi:hypothetical protein
MIQDPQQDFAAILDTITDAAQHALNAHTATIADHESHRPSLNRPGGMRLDN